MGGRAVDWTEKPCARCERPMIPQQTWRADPTTHEGRVRHGGGDHCANCYKTVHRAEAVEARPGRAARSRGRGLVGERRQAALTVCSMTEDPAVARDVLEALGLLEPVKRVLGDVRSGPWR